MMRDQIDRISGVLFIVFGLLVYFVIIPWQVEIVDYGALRPKTLPQILATVITLCGLALLVSGGRRDVAADTPWLRPAAFAAVLAGGLYAISWFGFLWVAPALSAVLMLMMRERRPLWLTGGILAMPAAIWFFIAFLLERPLP